MLKWNAGKIVLPDPPRHWIEQQNVPWSLDCRSLKRVDIFRASELPKHRRDPFDRLLVAAALGATATIPTPHEAAIHEYPVSCRWQGGYDHVVAAPFRRCLACRIRSPAAATVKVCAVVCLSRVPGTIVRRSRR